MKNRKKSRSILMKLIHYIGRYRFLLYLSLAFSLVSVILQLYVPNLYGDAIDQIIAEGNVNFSEMWYYLNKIVVFIIVAGIALWISSLINNHVTYHIVGDLRKEAMEHIQKLPLSYLDQHSTGDIVSRIVTDCDILSDGLLLGFQQLFSGIVTIAVTVFFMISKNILISVLVIAITPLSFFIAKFISSKSYVYFQRQSVARGSQTAFIDEMIGNEKVVQAFAHQKNASKQFEKLNADLKKESQKAVFYSSITNPSTRFVNNITYAIVALSGAFMIFNGRLTVGGLSVLLSYANQYMKPFNDISSVITEMQNALACASRIFELLEAPVESNEGTKILKNVEGNVSIKNVCFSYVPEVNLIENFNLEVKPGMRIAIVGPTGCGKTTFINLLMRFYEINTGSISIDGTNITDLDRHALRKCYGMVLQDTWIKNGTVRENITFGKPDATEEEMIQAAKASHSYEFIRQLPQQFDTVLNENSLSQGQKQLLCITRVMLCLPPMLILDEATSSIDTRTELQIQQTFDTLMKDRTSFVVAHRLSTIRNASLILVMNKGHIIEQGNHEELLKQNGFYAKLYNSQFQES